MKKLNSGYDHWEEFELAPGLKATVRYEGNNGLPEVVEKFLQRKASIGELRQTLKARGSRRYLDIPIASSQVINKNLKEVI